MLENIEPILRDQCHLVIGKPIIVGVSGGPDSLCLMETLRQAGHRIIVAHFNHRLRNESDHDANLVEKTTSRLMIPSVIESGDVRAHADKNGMSIEEAARDLRYRFLFRVAHHRDAQAVAVGHTADDQVETVLMHFLRGAGLAGMKGMTYVTHLPVFDADIPVVRPLLDVWREETVVFCAANGLVPHYDLTNDSVSFLRNRIRNLLIPSLETYNPKFKEAVWRTSQTLNADHDLLMELLDVEWMKCNPRGFRDHIVLDAISLGKYPLGLQRNLLRRAITTLRPGLEINYSALERATQFLNESRSHVDLKAGLRIFREGGDVILAMPNADLPFENWPQLPGDTDLKSFSVPLPGQVNLSGSWKFTSEKWRIPTLAREQAETNQDPFQVWLDADMLPIPLEIRVRNPGDRFEPLGMNGHSQKLSDFFVNEKMPQRARERWPLLCSGENVIWVPGYRPAHPYRLSSETKNVVYFAVTRLMDRIPEG